jgi:desulfoferrodoxin (superoxide reductase-like protein)
MIDAMKEKQVEFVEMKEMMDQIHQVKIDVEVQNAKVAASFAEWTFT